MTTSPTSSVSGGNTETRHCSSGSRQKTAGKNRRKDRIKAEVVKRMYSKQVEGWGLQRLKESVICGAVLKDYI